MGFIGLGIALIILGVLLGLFGAGFLGGALSMIGWVLLIAGILLAVLHFAAGATHGHRREHH